MSLRHDEDQVNGEWPTGFDPELDGYVWEISEPGPSLEDLDAAAELFGEGATDYERVDGDDLSDISSGLLMSAGWPRTRAEFELRRLGVMSRELAERISRTRFDAGLD
jgi:hypothetical protein